MCVDLKLATSEVRPISKTIIRDLIVYRLELIGDRGKIQLAEKPISSKNKRKQRKRC